MLFNLKNEALSYCAENEDLEPLYTADEIERKDAAIAELEAHLAASDERVEFLRASFDTAMALLRDAQKMVSDYQSRS